MKILVNSWIRDITCLVNVGPDRTGVVAPSQASLLRRIGAYMSIYGTSVYGTRGGPWEPVDGQYGFTWRDNTFYVHLLPGHSGTTFTTPSIGGAQVSRVFDVASGAGLSYAVDSTGQVTVTGINRTHHPEDSVVGITLDRSVLPADIAAGRTATADSEETGKGNTAGKAVDSSTSTRWCANDGNTGHWLKVDLGSAKPITGVRIAWELDATNYRYRIEGSSDNSTWTTLADRTATASTSQVQVAVFAARARYVRVTVTGLPSGAWASIRAFEVHDRPFATTSGVVTLVNRNSRKVLDIADASTADGGVAIRWPDTGGNNQKCTLTANSDGSFRPVNVRSGKLLESPAGSAQGAQLVQWSDTGADNQSWRLVPSQTSGYHQIVNVRTGWCAEVSGASTQDGAWIVGSPATGGAGQDWRIIGL